MQKVGFFVIFALYPYNMKRPPKRYAGGGEIPKFKTRAEFDKYYSSNPNYAIDPLFSSPGNARYYDKNNLTFDAAKKQYSGGDIGAGAWTSTPKASNFFEFTAENPIANAKPGKAEFVDSGRKPLFTGNPNYQAFQYPDELGQYANATTKYFDTKTQKEIDPSKSIDTGGKYYPRFKYGGLVKKLGYAYGGPVQDPTQESLSPEELAAQQKQQEADAIKNQANSALASGGINAAGQLADIGGKYISSKATNYNGTIDPEQAAAGGALSGAAKGAQLGMAAGPYGALAGGIAGGLIGGGIKYYGAKNVNSDIAYGERQAENDKTRTDQQNLFDSELAKHMAERGYKKGGVVKGKGTSKSDSIYAKVLPGSFIVPAEKVGLLKSKVNVTKKKANLNQSGGENIKVSKDEWILDPSEKEEIIAELGEEFLEALAPLAKHHMYA